MIQAVRDLRPRQRGHSRTSTENTLAFGNGWDNPISLTDHRQNRRVEVKVFPIESK